MKIEHAYQSKLMAPRLPPGTFLLDTSEQMTQECDISLQNSALRA